MPRVHCKTRRATARWTVVVPRPSLSSLAHCNKNTTRIAHRVTLPMASAPPAPPPTLQFPRGMGAKYMASV